MFTNSWPLSGSDTISFKMGAKEMTCYFQSILEGKLCGNSIKSLTPLFMILTTFNSSRGFPSKLHSHIFEVNALFKQDTSY